MCSKAREDAVGWPLTKPFPCRLWPQQLMLVLTLKLTERGGLATALGYATSSGLFTSSAMFTDCREASHRYLRDWTHRSTWQQTSCWKAWSWHNRPMSCPQCYVRFRAHIGYLKEKRPARRVVLGRFRKIRAHILPTVERKEMSLRLKWSWRLPLPFIEMDYRSDSAFRGVCPSSRCCGMWASSWVYFSRDYIRAWSFSVGHLSDGDSNFVASRRLFHFADCGVRKTCDCFPTARQRVIIYTLEVLSTALEDLSLPCDEHIATGTEH